MLLASMAGGIDAAELQMVMDNVLKSELRKQKVCQYQHSYFPASFAWIVVQTDCWWGRRQLELEAFVQAQVSNLGLNLAGMQQNTQ